MKNKYLLRIFFILLFASATFTIGCKKEENEEPPSVNGEFNGTTTVQKNEVYFKITNNFVEGYIYTLLEPLCPCASITSKATFSGQMTDGKFDIALKGDGFANNCPIKGQMSGNTFSGTYSVTAYIFTLDINSNLVSTVASGNESWSANKK